MQTHPIVVGTDLSNSANDAVVAAASYAKRSGAKLLVVHVAPDEIFSALETPKVARALSDRVAALVGDGVNFEVTIEPGSPHSALVKAADHVAAELVVVGASGATKRALLGGTAERVVRYAHGKVLVVRAPSSGPVLAAADFSSESEHVVAVAAEEARRRNAPLVVVHAVYDPVASWSLLGPLVIAPPELPQIDRMELENIAKKTLSTLAEAAGAKSETRVLHGPAGSAVVECAKEIRASLVVVATRGRTGLARIALGSVAEDIVHDAPCSVLAVRRATAD